MGALLGRHYEAISGKTATMLLELEKGDDPREIGNETCANSLVKG